MSPGRCLLISAISSSRVLVALPSTWVMMSPGFRPAFSAGLAGRMLLIWATSSWSGSKATPSTPLNGAMRRRGTLSTPTARGVPPVPAEASHWPTLGWQRVQAIDGSPVASIFSMARSYCSWMPTMRAGSSRPSPRRQTILPSNSLALVSTQPSGPTIVPRMVSSPSQSTRAVQSAAPLISGPKACLTGPLSRPSIWSSQASPFLSRSQFSWNTSMGTWRFMSAGPPMRLWMPITRPSRSNSGPPESPPTSGQSL